MNESAVCILYTTCHAQKSGLAFVSNRFCIDTHSTTSISQVLHHLLDDIIKTLLLQAKQLVRESLPLLPVRRNNAPNRNHLLASIMIALQHLRPHDFQLRFTILINSLELITRSLLQCCKHLQLRNIEAVNIEQLILRLFRFLQNLNNSATNKRQGRRGELDISPIKQIRFAPSNIKLQQPIAQTPIEEMRIDQTRPCQISSTCIS